MHVAIAVNIAKKRPIATVVARDYFLITNELRFGLNPLVLILDIFQVYTDANRAEKQAAEERRDQ